jgi:RNA polymerase sigma-70 factor, ECF subfamily
MSTIDAVIPSPAVDLESFLAVRPRLFGIAYRILGSAAEADEVVQDTWIRWHGAEPSTIRDATAFLATIATRLAINVSQSARQRRETNLGPWLAEPVDAGADPARAVERDEALEHAVLALVEKLSPTERAVLVLREGFDYPYRAVARVLGLSEANTRQLASRARGHLAGDRRFRVDATEHRHLLEAVVAAAQHGQVGALEQVLLEGIRAGVADISRCGA